MISEMCRNCWYYNEVDRDTGICKNPFLFAVNNTTVEGTKRMKCFKSQYDILASAGNSKGQTKLL